MRHEISGVCFQYQVGSNHTSEAIAARFGEPATTIVSESGEHAILLHNRLRKVRFSATC